MRPTCGWCSGLGRCRESDASGAGCPSGWAWFGNECSDICYSRSNSCGECTAGPTCGYCYLGGSVVCLDGSGFGPDSFYHDCFFGWAWYSTDCP